jgi:hypothetical protein
MEAVRWAEASSHTTTRKRWKWVIWTWIAKEFGESVGLAFEYEVLYFFYMSSKILNLARIIPKLLELLLVFISSDTNKKLI